MAPAPVDRLDGAGIQIGSLFYVFAGYQTIDKVLPLSRIHSENTSLIELKLVPVP